MVACLCCGGWASSAPRANEQNGVQAWVRGGSGQRIDTMYFAAPDAPEVGLRWWGGGSWWRLCSHHDVPMPHTYQGAESTTVIVCCPNAATYELSYEMYNSTYHPLGINVFCWNYRGYGRSEGAPSISACRTDGTRNCHVTRL